MSLYANRLSALRAQLARDGLDGFVVPISDEHMSEYVGAYAQRLAWLTGFDGSAGTAVVLAGKAAVFVDGRYTLQLREQVDGALWDFEDVPATSPAKWLGEHASAGARIGFDPWLHSRPWVRGAEAALAGRGGVLVPVAANPVDAVWDDRPAPSAAPAQVHPLAYAGVGARDKRETVAAWLAAEGLDAVVIAALDSVGWLFNIRGSDVARTPVALGFAIAHADGTADLFLAPEKVTAELVAHLGDGAGGVRLRDYAAFAPALAGLSGRRVAVDPERCVAAIFTALEDAGAEVREARDPTVLPRACKNPVEQAGHRAAQARDGAAMARFLHWLSVEGPKGTLTEQGAADHLEALRREGGQLVDLSFDTISGAGPNGAIVHYRVSEASNRVLAPGSVYLVDSGGQYRDGTTDLTRTVWIGPDAPPAGVRDHFTRVLKGNIALSRAVFPAGTNGSQLDTLARQFLWASGLDYAHGTGHGVGSYLSVHEGPQRIAKSSGGQAGTGQALLPGMILSNEPGYYRAGAYGIRIENLLMVEERAIEGAEGSFLGFEVLSLVPIDRALVAVDLLDGAERAWWQAYHARVWAVLSPQLDGAALAWLEEACRPL